MDNTLQLIPGKSYSVIKRFVDYDGMEHAPGETWVYRGTNFLPYEDGLTLHVEVNGVAAVYRLQWRPEKQGDIIDHFREYVSGAG